MSILSICFLTGLMYYKYLKMSIRIFLVYVIISFIVEWLGVYSLYISQYKKINFEVYYLYTTLNFVIISTYFYQIINRQRFKLIILWIIPFTVLVMIGLIYWKEILVHKLLLINVFFFVLYAILYFSQLLRSNENVLASPHFWIVTGILFFHAGFFFLSGFINYISSKDLELAKKLFSINHILNIIYYSLVTYGFICQRRLARLSS